MCLAVNFFFVCLGVKIFSDKLSWKGFIKISDTNLVQNLMLINIFHRNLLVKCYSAFIRLSKFSSMIAWNILHY